MIRLTQIALNIQIILITGHPNQVNQIVIGIQTIQTALHLDLVNQIVGRHLIMKIALIMIHGYQTACRLLNINFAIVMNQNNQNIQIAIVILTILGAEHHNLVNKTVYRIPIILIV